MITYAQARRIAILAIGLSVMLFGVALLVLPGPGVVTIWLGLGILATEFAWARHWLNRMKQSAGDAGRSAANWLRRDPPGERPMQPHEALRDDAA